MDNLTAKKKRILMLLDNPFTNDRRVYREAVLLAENGYSVDLIATISSSHPEFEIIQDVKVHRIFNQNIFDPKQQQVYLSYAKLLLEKFNFDIIHAHDHSMLHLGATIKKISSDKILIYDSHELFHSWPLNISNYKNKWIWLKSLLVRKLQIRREHQNRKAIDYLITVNQSLATNLKAYLNIENEVLILRNTPERYLLKEKSTILRETFSIPNDKKILVFIGANIYRNTLNIEQVLEEFKHQTDFALVFICAFNANYRQVQEYVIEKKYQNIFFHDLIKPDQIPTYLSSADIGLVPTWNKKDLSYWYALDNKLFEYLQSGIPVLATKQPEYLNVINDFECGVCVNPDSKGAYFEGFAQILSDYKKYKNNAEFAADKLCWENERAKLIEFYNTISNG